MKNIFAIVLIFLSISSLSAQITKEVMDEWEQTKIFLNIVDSTANIAKSQKLNFITKRSKIKYKSASTNATTHQIRVKFKNGISTVNHVYKSKFVKLKMTTENDKLIMLNKKIYDSTNEFSILYLGGNHWKIHLRENGSFQSQALYRSIDIGSDEFFEWRIGN